MAGALVGDEVTGALEGDGVTGADEGVEVHDDDGGWDGVLVINQMNRQVHCRATTPKAKGECEDAWCLVGRSIDGGVT